MEPYQVLIIEDDKDAANFFELVFTLLGFRCMKAYTLKAAFASLESTIPDLILLDLYLGGTSSGEQILHKVRLDDRFERTRVVVVTAYPIMARAISDLADLVLIKPVDIEQLKMLANRLMGLEIRPRAYFYRDPNTDLFNQEFFQTRLEHAFERSKRRPDFYYGVVLIALEVESVAEQTLPAVTLKQIYRAVAERLRGSFRPTDTLAYMEGNLFASLHEELSQPADIEVIVRRLRELLSQPLEVQGRTFRLRLALGAATNAEKPQHANELLQRAHQALKEAQRPSLGRRMG